jgi:hypothetical protein
MGIVDTLANTDLLWDFEPFRTCAQGSLEGHAMHRGYLPMSSAQSPGKIVRFRGKKYSLVRPETADHTSSWYVKCTLCNLTHKGSRVRPP